MHAPAQGAARLYSAYVFDMDGTLYLGNELLPGVARTISELRRREIPVRFLTNNPTKDPAEYAVKLTRLGIPTPVDEIVNTVGATVHWLRQHRPNAVVYPIAERPVVDALTAAGFLLSEDPTRIDVVLASYDRGFAYRKLQVAFDALWRYRRAVLVATNPDPYCPLPGGRGEPDCAAVVAAIEACTGVTCTAVVGKPNPDMLHHALRGLDLPLQDCVMVGDRLSTDIAMARSAGAASALPLTGESKWEDVLRLRAEERPTYVLDRLDHLLPEEVRGSSNG